MSSGSQGPQEEAGQSGQSDRYLIPDNLKGRRGFVIEWVVYRGSALALIALCVVAAIRWNVSVLVLLPFLLLGAALWMVAFVVHAWRFGRPYSGWWGVDDGYSPLHGRIRLDNVVTTPLEQIESYRWTIWRLRP